MDTPAPDAETRRKHARYLAICAATVAFCLVFVAPAFFPLRVLWYFPLEHRWELAVKPKGLAMDFYGRVLWSVICALPGYALVRWLAGRGQRVSAGALTLWTAWMATAALLAMSLFTYQLVRRQPKPVDLPAWYEPR